MAEKTSKWKKFKRQVRRAMTPTWFAHFSYQVFAFLVSVAMIFGVATYAFTKSYEESELYLPADFTISARADLFNAKDNSTTSTDNIIKNGIGVCEVDVHSRPNKTLVVSKELVVTNNDGYELSKVFEQIKSKDVMLNLNVRVAIDLKELNALVEKYNMHDRVFVTGIEIYQASSAKENLVSVPYYINYIPSRMKIFTDNYQQKVLEIIENSGAVGMNCPYAHAGGKLSETLHNNGYKLSVTGVDNSIKMKRILVCSPNNISTDDYYQLKELIDNWNN